MAPRTILAQLVVALKDDASQGAKALAQNLKGLEKSAVDFAKTMQGAKWGAGFTGTLSAGNSKKKMLLQQRMGLRQKNGRLSTNDRDLIAQNPHVYAWDRLKPALQKDGIGTNNEAAVSESLNQLYTRTVADLFSKLISQQAQYRQTQDRMRKALGLAAADELAKRVPFVPGEGVTAQLTNLAAEISRPILDTISPALRSFAGTLGSRSKAICKDSALGKMLGIGAATVGGVVGGGAALGAFRGALPGGGGIIGDTLTGVGRTLPLLARGGGAAGLAYGAYGVATTGADLLSGIGGAAAGGNYTPRDAEGVFDLATQLRELNVQIAGKSNADLDRLEGQSQEPRNRITAGTAGMGGEIVQSLANVSRRARPRRPPRWKP